MQNRFVFVDTESYNNQLSKEKEILSFKLGCVIFWNKLHDIVIHRTYRHVNKFWINVESFFNLDNKDVIMFAHNTQFDFKMLNGFDELFNRGWDLISQYVKNKTFILIFQKQITKRIKYTLHIWDTMNYVPRPLEKIGESVGFPKLSVNFNTVSNKKLKIYCQRDTEIIFQFIKKLVNFLEVNDLSRLKATAGSLSFNTFRHKFYNPEKEIEKSKIFIHSWQKAIKLERLSYKGGITDCFKIGISKEQLYKLDINSMYSSIMEKMLLPYKLVGYFHENKHSNETLWKIYQKVKQNNYGVIVKATIDLGKNDAYILNNFGTGKSLFAQGKFKVCLCSPELEFVESCGNEIKIHEINIYSMKVIFEEFVKFFFSLRIKAKKENNLIDDEFCKLMLNTQYGKWGQKEIEYKKLDINSDFIKKHQYIILMMLKRMKEKIPNFNFGKEIAYLGNIVDEGELYVICGQLYLLKQTSNNAKDSFVAISSFITSYARMMLINYLKIAERENVHYCDTDSLFVNQIGYDNLYVSNCVHPTQLGKLKIEAEGVGSFYAPKFYDFNDERKCKGIKKNSKLLKENHQKAIYEVQNWQKWKTDLKTGYSNKQIIKIGTKEANKIYTKGKIDNKGNVIPFHVSEIIALSK